MIVVSVQHTVVIVIRTVVVIVVVLLRERKKVQSKLVFSFHHGNIFDSYL